jgi:hypothetical protein
MLHDGGGDRSGTVAAVEQIISTMQPQGYRFTTLTEALTPAVRLSCHWRTHDGRAIVSTLAEVAPDAAPIADASLRGQGFTCASTAGSLECTRLSGEVLEEQTIRGGLWLSSLERGWPRTRTLRLLRGRAYFPPLAVQARMQLKSPLQPHGSAAFTVLGAGGADLFKPIALD